MQPRMLVGPYEGQLLAWLTVVINPHRVLEIGTYCGYSSLCIDFAYLCHKDSVFVRE